MWNFPKTALGLGCLFFLRALASPRPFNAQARAASGAWRGSSLRWRSRPVAPGVGLGVGVGVRAGFPAAFNQPLFTNTWLLLGNIFPMFDLIVV